MTLNLDVLGSDVLSLIAVVPVKTNMASIATQDVIQRMNENMNTNYKQLRPKQEEALKACRNGDVLAVLPTGYGKTIIIQANKTYIDIDYW